MASLSQKSSLRHWFGWGMDSEIIMGIVDWTITRWTQYAIVSIYGCLDTSTHWGRVTHICISKLTIIGSDNGLSPGRRQDIIWTKAGLLLIGPLETNFSEILIEILTSSFKKMRLKVSKRRPFCLGFNVLMLKQCAWLFTSDSCIILLCFGSWGQRCITCPG